MAARSRIVRGELSRRESYCSPQLAVFGRLADVTATGSGIHPENPGGGFSHGHAGRYQNYQSQAMGFGTQIKEINERRAKVETERNEAIAREGQLRGEAYFTLGSIHTISYSSFREKFAVRSLGRTQAKTYTRGPRTIAGSIIFNVMQEHELLRLLGLANGTMLDHTGASHTEAVMIDQVQPFNLMFLFEHEYG